MKAEKKKYIKQLLKNANETLNQLADQAPWWESNIIIHYERIVTSILEQLTNES